MTIRTNRKPSTKFTRAIAGTVRLFAIASKTGEDPEEYFADKQAAKKKRDKMNREFINKNTKSIFKRKKGKKTVTEDSGPYYVTYGPDHDKYGGAS